LCTAAFARLFYHGPRFAIMDESTSALDEETEAKCLQRCLTRGISLVSVGHRPSLRAFHTHLLLLRPDATYTVTPLTQATVGHSSLLRRLHEPHGGAVSTGSGTGSGGFAVGLSAVRGAVTGRHGSVQANSGEDVAVTVAASPLADMQQSLLGADVHGHATVDNDKTSDVFADDTRFGRGTPMEEGNPWGDAVFDADPRDAGVDVSFGAVFVRRFVVLLRLGTRLLLTFLLVARSRVHASPLRCVTLRASCVQRFEERVASRHSCCCPPSR
jgi:hypothetical protein